MLVRSIVLGFVVTAGLLLSSSQVAAQDERSFFDFSKPEFTVNFVLSVYEDFEEEEFRGRSPLGGGAASLFAGHPVCTGTGGLDSLEGDAMFGGFGVSGAYSRAGGWPWDSPLGGAGGGAGGGAADPPVLALTHGTAVSASILVRPTWYFPGLQGERLAWNVVGGIGIHSQQDGEAAVSGPQGLTTWGIQGQTNLTYNIAVTTEYALSDNLGLRAMARMNWMQRDDVTFVQPGGGTVTAPGETLSWGQVGVGLTLRPNGR